MYKLSNYRSIVWIFLGLFFINNSYGDYIFYKVIDAGGIEYLDEDSYSRVFNEIKKYEFPMTTDASFIDCLRSKEIEEDCIKIKLAQLDPPIQDLKINYVPPSLMQMNAILLSESGIFSDAVYFLKKLKKNAPGYRYFREDARENNIYFESSNFIKDLFSLDKKIDDAQANEYHIKDISDRDADEIFLGLTARFVNLEYHNLDNMMHEHASNVIA